MVLYNIPKKGEILLYWNYVFTSELFEGPEEFPQVNIRQFV